MRKSAIGLLRRASRIKQRKGATEPLSALSSPEEDEGLTAEERRAIIADIDEVAVRNKISGPAGGSRAIPLKKGFVFPLVVNVLALVLTALALAGLALAFRQREQGLAEGNAVVTTAEGKLIQEIKRESDSKLREKDRAIAEIQGRLSSIDRQRSELAATIEQRISAKETELRAELKAELEKERARLADQGLSESAIQERMKSFEARKTAELNRQMEDFRKRVEEERAAEEARLAEAREEYQRSISGLNDERKRILDEARKSEDRLRAALDARARELEGQSAAAQARAAKAQSELAGLEEQRARTQAAEERIIGLYGSIRDALRERRFQDALSSVAALQSYLTEPSLMAVPNLKARRDADLFIAGALGGLARAELERSSIDTARLLGQAELLASLRADAAAGDSALKAGELAAAAAKYQAALAAVPEILAAHDYFMGAAREEAAAEAARLRAALEAGERAWRAGDRGESSRRYAEALAMLPVDEDERAALLERLSRPDPKAQAEASRASDSAAARDAFASASRNLAAGKWPEAIALFVGLVGAHPAAEQAPAALKGIETARQGMERDFEDRSAVYEKTIADLRAQAGSQAASLEAESERSTPGSTTAEAEPANGDAERKLQAAQAEVARLQRQLEAATAAAADASAKSGAVSAETAAAAAMSSEDARALDDLRAQAKDLREEYENYVAAESASSGNAGDFAVLDRQKRLLAFLGGKELKALFPELGGIVDSQFNAYRQQLSMETLRTAADIAIQAATAKTAPEKRATLDANAKHYAGDPTISDFIGVLRELLK
jgi:hypothetical protein